MKRFYIVIFFFIHCYLNPGNLDKDRENVLEPTRPFGFAILNELQQNSIGSFQIKDLKVESTYPNVKFTWTETPQFQKDISAEIGISSSPILTDEDCQSKIWKSYTTCVITSTNNTCNFSNFIITSGRFLQPNITYYSHDFRVTPNVLTYYTPCPFCTQGATLYFCARTRVPVSPTSGGGTSQTITTPWIGATVQTVYQ